MTTHQAPCDHLVEEWDQITGFISCSRCGDRLRWRCPYAEIGSEKCPPWRCDCFIDQYPESPLGLHPEAFIVGRPAQEEP